jgi:hypothetical protein
MLEHSPILSDYNMQHSKTLLCAGVSLGFAKVAPLVRALNERYKTWK